MSPPQTMGSLLGRPGMFYRSVALERDVLDPSASRGYVLTPWLERRVTEILSCMRADATRRAWRVIGDFGVGNRPSPSPSFKRWIRAFRILPCRFGVWPTGLAECRACSPYS